MEQETEEEIGQDKLSPIDVSSSLRSQSREIALLLVAQQEPYWQEEHLRMRSDEVPAIA